MRTRTLNKKIEEREALRPQIIPTRQGVELNGGLLPQAADDLTAEQGLAVYRRMESEPAIAAADVIMRALVVECGWETGTAVEEPKKKTGRSRAEVQARKDYDLAERVRLYIHDLLENLETPLVRVLWQALAAHGDGHKLFEKVRDFVTEHDGSAGVRLVQLKAKPRTAYRLAVTRYMDFVGAKPERGGLLILDDWTSLSAEEQNSFAEPDDLFLFSLRGEDGDPRGKAAKRAAYDAWYRKQQYKVESFKHAAQFGSGRVSLEGPAPTKDVVPAKVIKVNGKDVALIDYLASQLSVLMNGSWAILPDGWKMNVHAGTTSDVFEKGFDRCDREMTLAYLTVTRATQEAEHGSKADSQTAEGLLAKFINWLRWELSTQFREQVIIPEVAMRFGQDVAKRFSPYLLMHVVDQEDIPSLLSAVSQGILSGAITEEQLPYWDRKLGQPERDVEDTKEPASKQEEDDTPDEPTFAEVKERKKVPGQAVYRDLIRTRRGRIDSHLSKYEAGDIDAQTLGERLDKEFADSHRVAYVLGRQRAGDTYKETEDDRARAERAYKADAEFFKSFIDDVKRGRYGEGEDFDAAAVRRRAMMYVHKARSTANAAFIQYSPAGSTFDYLLGESEHCEDCPRRAEGSPYDKADCPVPADGNTACLTECTCFLRRSDGRTGFMKVYDAD